MNGNNPLKAWMAIATPAEQQELADEVCSGSRQYLYHWANNHREPGPTAGAQMERLTAKMSRRTEGRLPTVWRVDMVRVCGACEFAKKCMAQEIKS